MAAVPSGVVIGDLALVGSNTSIATFRASRSSTRQAPYVFQLAITVLDQDLVPDVTNTLTNDAGQVIGRVSVVVRDVPPVADAGQQATGLSDDGIPLDASGSRDANIVDFQETLDKLVFEWVVTEKPDAAAITSFEPTANIVAPEFKVASGNPGTYQVRVVVSDAAPLASGTMLQVIGGVGSAGATATLPLVDADGVAPGDDFVSVGIKVGDFARFFPAGKPSVMLQISVVTASQLTIAAPAEDIPAGTTFTVSDAAQDFLTVIVNDAANFVPSADAGRDRLVNNQVDVLLDGRGSRDPEGTELTFLWTEDDGNPDAVLDTGDATAAVVSLTIETAGTYRFLLVVTDDDGAGLASAPDSVFVVVADVQNAQNPKIPPVAAANVVGLQAVDFDGDGLIDERERFGRVGESVILSSARSVDDQSIEKFRWRQVGGAKLSGFDTDIDNDGINDGLVEAAVVSFVPLSADTYRFELQVEDDLELLSLPVFVDVKVIGESDAGPPMAVAPDNVEGQIQDPPVPVSLSAAGSGIGSENAPIVGSSTAGQVAAAIVSTTGFDVRFQWSQIEGPPVDLLNADTADPTFTPTVPGRYVFLLVVTDNSNGVSDQTEVVVSVDSVDNGRPIALITAVDDRVLPDDIGIELEIQLNASRTVDPEGDTLTFDWEQIEGQAVVLDLTDPAVPRFRVGAPSAFRFRLTVSDDAGNVSTPAEVAFFVAARSGIGQVNRFVEAGDDGGLFACRVVSQSTPVTLGDLLMACWYYLALMLAVVLVRWRRTRPLAVGGEARLVDLGEAA